MEIDEVTAPKLKRRFPIDMRIRTYIVVVISSLIILTAVFKTNQIDVAAFFLLVMTLFFLVNHGLDWGYQFAFDDLRMYQRPKGWRWFFRRLRWYSVAYKDISRIETIFGADGAVKSRFFPFEFILIYGKSGADGDNVVLYPPSFPDSDIKGFLEFLYAKRPELFPQEVIDYMHSDRGL
jgi:hypothetical protein